MRASFSLIFAGLLAAILAPVGSAIAAPTAAPLNFCNRASVQALVFVGYYSSGVDNGQNHLLTGPFVSRGFWRVDAGQCKTFDNPFDARYMFWFAIEHDTPRRHPVVDDATAVHMCVGVKGVVTLEDENASQDACEKSPDRAWVMPEKVDTAVDPNVNFTGDDY